ncbi:ATP-binding protein [Couchioplanes azureus]|uniref:ATP-binding protein n=1 Tax=Couchioplanes caeruleus TaxID=56438 RepID=UPI0016713E6D|nr:ATP-binding protein [Couchioplanes caeruleus]
MLNLAPTLPPADAEVLHVWVLDERSQLPTLKASLLDVVIQQRPLAQYAIGTVDKMMLVATELAANAITYGLPPTVVRLFADGPSLIVDIADHDTQIPPEFADAQPPGAGGLGLRLALKFALAVGWYATDTTKHIWAEFLNDDTEATSRATAAGSKPTTAA